MCILSICALTYIFSLLCFDAWLLCVHTFRTVTPFWEWTLLFKLKMTFSYETRSQKVSYSMFMKLPNSRDKFWAPMSWSVGSAHYFAILCGQPTCPGLTLPTVLSSQLSSSSQGKSDDLYHHGQLACAFPLCFVCKEAMSSARFSSTYTKIGTIQRRLAWALSKDDMQIREAFHIFIYTMEYYSAIKEFIWISSNEMDETGAHYTEWSKPER